MKRCEWMGGDVPMGAGALVAGVTTWEASTSDWRASATTGTTAGAGATAAVGAVE